jgi:hypothetical protein
MFLTDSTVLMHEMNTNDLILYNYGLGGLVEKSRFEGSYKI